MVSDRLISGLNDLTRILLNPRSIAFRRVLVLCLNAAASFLAAWYARLLAWSRNFWGESKLALAFKAIWENRFSKGYRSLGKLKVA
jgi:hypothetical protein